MGMRNNITLESVRILTIFLLSVASIFFVIPVSIITAYFDGYSIIASALSIELCRFGYVYVCHRWLSLISTPSLTFSIALMLLSILLVVTPDYRNGLIEVSYVNLVFIISGTLIGFCSGMIYLLLNIKGRILITGLPLSFLMMVSLYATNPLLGLIGGSLLEEFVFKTCFLFAILGLSVYLYIRVKAATEATLSE